MNILATAELPFPRDQVFEVYRDRLPDLVPHMSNVRSITLRSREEQGSNVHLVHHWLAKANIPAPARALLSEDGLYWDDHTTWDAETFTARWRLQTPYGDVMKVSGQLVVEPIDSARTRVTLSGDLVVDGNLIPGVPKLLARTVASVVEKFLVAGIKPNLLELSRGVEQYLSKKGS